MTTKFMHVGIHMKIGRLAGWMKCKWGDGKAKSRSGNGDRLMQCNNKQRKTGARDRVRALKGCKGNSVDAGDLQFQGSISP